MTADQTQQLLTSLANLGVAIISGAAPATAGSFALGAVVREVPHLIGLAATVLATGELTDAQKKQAHDEAVALSQGAAAVPAAT